MFCSQCGQRLEQVGRFCTNCGAPVCLPEVPPVPMPVAEPEKMPAPAVTEIPEAIGRAPEAVTEPVFESAEIISELVEEEFEEVISDFSKAPDSVNVADSKNNEEKQVAQEEFPLPEINAQAPVDELVNTAEIPAILPEMMAQPTPVLLMQPQAYPDNSEFNGYAEFPSVPMMTEESQVTPQAKKKKPHIAVAIILSVVFGIVVFALFLASSVLSGTRETLSEAEISQKIKKSQPLDWVVGDILLSDSCRDKVAKLLEDNKSKADIDDIKEDTTLGEFIVIVAGEDKISEKEIEEIANEIGAMETIGDVVEGYEKYFLENDGKEILSSDDIEKIVEDSVQVVEDISGNTVKLNSEKLENALEDNAEFIKALNPSDVLGKVGSITSIAFSPAVIIGLLVFAMILVILIGVISKRFSAASITFAVCAILTGLTLIIVPSIVEFAIDKIGVSFMLVSKLGVDIFVETLADSLKSRGLIALAAGGFAILVTVIVNAIAKAILKKKSLQNF